jgi:hypothetical protein
MSKSMDRKKEEGSKEKTCEVSSGKARAARREKKQSRGFQF